MQFFLYKKLNACPKNLTDRKPVSLISLPGLIILPEKKFFFDPPKKKKNRKKFDFFLFSDAQKQFLNIFLGSDFFFAPYHPFPDSATGMKFLVWAPKKYCI